MEPAACVLPEEQTLTKTQTLFVSRVLQVVSLLLLEQRRVLKQTVCQARTRQLVQVAARPAQLAQPTATVTPRHRARNVKTASTTMRLGAPLRVQTALMVHTPRADLQAVACVRHRTGCVMRERSATMASEAPASLWSCSRSRQPRRRKGFEWITCTRTRKMLLRLKDPIER